MVADLLRKWPHPGEEKEENEGVNNMPVAQYIVLSLGFYRMDINRRPSLNVGDPRSFLIFSV
jgi:hypothetical protein